MAIKWLGRRMPVAVVLVCIHLLAGCASQAPRELEAQGMKPMPLCGLNPKAVIQYKEPTEPVKRLVGRTYVLG